MGDLLFNIAKFAVLVHVLLIATAVYRIWRGENSVDRLIGVEMVSTLFLGILVLLAIIYDDAIYIDVALGLAALGFISTIALAKYATDEQIF